MLTVCSDIQRVHEPEFELRMGKVVPSRDTPARANVVKGRVEGVNIGKVIEAQDYGLDPLFAVHEPDYVLFLEGAWEMWLAAGRRDDALPSTFVARNLSDRRPDEINGLLGYYSFAADTPITRGSWRAAYGAAQAAITAAAQIVDGEPSTFAICRPPGHHATRNQFGGYCYLNNAAIAAEWLRKNGADRVAILDVDYHHGNGTQDIFYDRSDVYYLSVHADPRLEFPYFCGFADEVGIGEGRGFNHNYPLPLGTESEEWFRAFDRALAKAAAFKPDVLIVSLGVDTFEKDPIGNFNLQPLDFVRMGIRIRHRSTPTLFCMEGGFSTEEIGTNMVNVLQGFDGG